MKKQLLFTFMNLLLAANTFAQVPSYVPSSGLVGWWPFNGNANDESGNGNNGTVNGATLTGDRFGNVDEAYNFDGVDDYITINNTVGNFGVDNFSISLWYVTYTTNPSHLINKRFNESCGNWWEFRKEGFATNESCVLSPFSQFFSQVPAVNVWYNVLIIRNNTSINYYVNGVLTDSYNTASIDNMNNSNDLIVGCVIAPISGIIQKHNGQIDDIGIWNRALTDCEIQNLYNASIPAEPTNLACYETATFNTTTCQWDISGTQPQQPQQLNCWDNYQFNAITCSWENQGTQAPQPSGLACYESAQFNTATCQWDVTGTQPQQPAQVNCWDNYQFNNTSCTWINTGSQPQQPTLDCNDNATFNTTTCQWVVTVVNNFTANATLTFPNTITASPLGMSYQWINCATGQHLSSATNPIINVIDGEFAVIISDGICVDTSNCITVNTANVQEGEIILSLYPNPSNGLIVIEAQGVADENFTIYSMEGRQLKVGTLTNGLSVLDLQSFANGTYIFQTSKKQIKFVIQK